MGPRVIRNSYCRVSLVSGFVLVLFGRVTEFLRSGLNFRYLLMSYRLIINYFYIYYSQL